MHVSQSLAALAYLVAAVCFILALKGLSSPTSSRARQRHRHRRHGDRHRDHAWRARTSSPTPGSSPAWCIGGAIGVVIALRIQMTAMPQLVAAFHSLVGLAAVLVAAAAFYAPEAYGIADADGRDPAVEPDRDDRWAWRSARSPSPARSSPSPSCRAWFPARRSSFPGQHLLNLLLGLVVIGLGAWFVASQSDDWPSWSGRARSPSCIGVTLIIPIGGADMPVVISMLNCYSGWAAAGIGFTLENDAADHHRRAGRLVGRDPLLHHVQGDEPLVLQRHPGRLRRRGGRAGGGPGRPHGQAGQRRGRGLHHEERRARSSSCRATAWRWPRPSTRCARWPTC